MERWLTLVIVIFILMVISLLSVILPWLIGFGVVILLIMIVYIFVKRKRCSVQIQEFDGQYSSEEDNQATPTAYIPVTRQIEIIQDCIQILSTTTNPKTFSSRYTLLLGKIDLLTYAATVGGFSVEQLKTKFISNKAQLFKDFIDRSYAAAYESAKGLKTQKGRLNRMNKFFGELKPVDVFTYEQYLYIDSLEKNCIDALNNEVYV